MANNLKFSVLLEAVTQSFNTAIKQSKATYTDATSSIRKDSDALSAATATASAKLAEVFKAGDARQITAALQSATKELDSLKTGARLSTDELKRIGTVGKQAVIELKSELTKATAEVKALAASKASPADLDAARQKVAALTRDVGEASASYQRFQAAASAAMSRAATSTQEAATAAKGAGKAIYDSLNIRTGGTLRQEIAQITAQLSQFKSQAGAPAAEVARVTAAAEARIASLKNELKGVGTTSQGAVPGITAMGGSLLRLAGVGAGLAAIQQGLTAIIDTTIKFQGVNKQLEFAVGSARQAGIEFEFVKKTANELGLDLLSAADGYAKLASATKGTKLEGQGTRDIFLGVSQAAATMNLSVDQTNGVFLALSQIAGKGKVSMEELRGQLGERLPPAMKIAADSLGVTTQQLNQLVEDGLDSIEFLQAFGPALTKAFAADAAKNAETLQGRINSMRNEFNLLLNDLGKGSLSSGLGTVFADIAKALQLVRAELTNLDPTTVQALEQVFQQLYGVVRETLGALFNGVAQVIGILDSMAELVTGVANAFLGLDGSSEKVGFLTRTLQGLSIGLGVLQDGAKGISILFTATTGIVQAFFSAIAFGLSKVTFGDLSKSLGDLAKNLAAASQESFTKVEESVMKFQSSAVAAADKAIASTTEAATTATEVHQKSSEAVVASQEAIAKAAETSSAGVATSAGTAAAAVGSIGTAAATSATAVGAAASVTEDRLAGLTKAGLTVQQSLLGVQAIAKGLGADLANSLNGVSKEFQQNITDVNALSAKFNELEARGVNAAKLLADGLNGMLEKARNPKEIQELIQLWIQLGVQGKISSEAMQKGLTDASAKLDALKPGINSVTEAFKTFGLQTREEAAVLAKNYGDAFTILRESGKASAGQLQEAFVKYAKAAIDANGGIPPAALKAEAAMSGFRIEVDATGKALRILGKDGVTELGKVGDAAVKAKSHIEEMKRLQDLSGEQNRPKNQLGGIKDEFAAKGDTATGVGDVPASALNKDLDGLQQLLLKEKAGTLSGSDVALAQSVLEAATFNYEQMRNLSPGAQGLGGLRGVEGQVANARRLLEAARAAAGQSTAPTLGGGNRQGGFGGGGGNSKTTAPSVQAPSAPDSPSPRQADATSSGKQINVNFTLGGKNVSGQIDESDEARFLDLLKQAKGIT